MVEVLVKYFGKNLDVNTVSGVEIQGGRRVIYKIKGDNILKGTSGEAERWLCISDSKDGSGALSYGVYTKVLVCSNGMVRWSKAHGIKIMHSQKMEEKLKNFDKLYASSLGFNEKLSRKYELMMERRLTRKRMEELLFNIEGAKRMNQEDFVKEYSTRKWNKVQSLIECLDIEEKLQGRNVWGVLNAVTRYTNHVWKTDSNIFDSGKEWMVERTMRVLDKEMA
jgi:hypothetical protein